MSVVDSAWASFDVRGDEEHEPREEHDGRYGCAQEDADTSDASALPHREHQPVHDRLSPSHDDERGPDVLGHKVVRGLVVLIPSDNPQDVEKQSQDVRERKDGGGERHPASLPPRNDDVRCRRLRDRHVPHCLTLNRLEGNGSRGDQRPAIDTFAHSSRQIGAMSPTRSTSGQFVTTRDDKVGHEEDEEEHQEHRG